MPTYFKPLRRKIGVVTLVIACAFAVGWVRSWFYEDLLQVVLPDRLNGTHAIESSHSTISWTSVGTLLDVGEIYWSSIPVGKERETVLTEMWPQYPEFIRTKKSIRWEVRYWPIILTLTLLSAWLLLSKPRKPKTVPLS